MYRSADHTQDDPYQHRLSLSLSVLLPSDTFTGLFGHNTAGLGHTLLGFFFQVNNQNNVQHKPVGEPEGLHQQSTSACGLYDQCKRYGNSFSDTGLFLQNQGDQVTRNDRGRYKKFLS